MKIRNQTIYSDDEATLKRLKEEYTMLGRDTELEEGKLIVFALPRWARSRKQKKQDAKRNKGRKGLTRNNRHDSL